MIIPARFNYLSLVVFQYSFFFRHSCLYRVFVIVFNVCSKASVRCVTLSSPCICDTFFLKAKYSIPFSYSSPSSPSLLSSPSPPGSIGTNYKCNSLLQITFVNLNIASGEWEFVVACELFLHFCTRFKD